MDSTIPELINFYMERFIHKSSEDPGSAGENTRVCFILELCPRGVVPYYGTWSHQTPLFTVSLFYDGVTININISGRKRNVNFWTTEYPPRNSLAKEKRKMKKKIRKKEKRQR